MKNSTFPARLAVLLLTWLLLMPAARAAPPGPDLPDLGDESAAVLTPLEERRLGEDFMRQARAQLDIVDDPVLNEYLQGLGHRLTSGAKVGQEFRFFLVNNPTINAFAVPGGFVGVHTGLLLAARNEAEVAAVLAHETAHITQRHIPRMIAESQRTSAPTLAAILAGILIAASGHQGGEAAIALATAGAAQHELNFTRNFEEEADRIGMNILNASGYDARAMPAFFERMEALSRVYESNLPEFLRTHPITERRIAESYNHAERFPARKNPSDHDFEDMQARLRVLTTKPDEALKVFRNTPQAKNAMEAEAQHYGLAVALLANRLYPEARQESAALSSAHPEYIPYHLLRAEIELASGQTVAGLETYKDAVRRYPKSLAVVQSYATALVQAGKSSEARDLLDKAVRERPDEPALFRLLAKAAGESGRPMEAHRAYGEYYYLIGQPRAAIEQFELAIRHANKNFYYVSSFEARIKEIREQNALAAPRDSVNKKKLLWGMK
jgi:predicted Zn-dependent protease